MTVKIQNCKNKKFGITVSACRLDVPLLKGCLASLRANLGNEIEICIIPDNVLNLQELSDIYNAKIMDVGAVDPRLREYSFGYGFTKMVAFWHSPFETFLHIDADTVFWGNPIRNLPKIEFDFIFNEPHEAITEQIIRSQYFDQLSLFSKFEAFDVTGVPFFNAGVFMARRGILDLDEYIELRKFQIKSPKTFISGEQGLLNYMVFKRIRKGAIVARQWPFQTVVAVTEPCELQRKFRFVGGRPIVEDNCGTVIHWAGPKPFLTRDRAFTRPMTYYRLKHVRRTNSRRRHLGSVGLFMEEIDTKVAHHFKGNYLLAAKLGFWKAATKLSRIFRKPKP